MRRSGEEREKQTSDERLAAKATILGKSAMLRRQQYKNGSSINDEKKINMRESIRNNKPFLSR